MAVMVVGMVTVMVMVTVRALVTFTAPHHSHNFRSTGSKEHDRQDDEYSTKGYV